MTTQPRIPTRTDSTFPTETSLPDTVELIHCQTAGRIVGIRLASGVMLPVLPCDDRAPTLHASESAIRYTAGADALIQAAKDDAEWTERLDREDWEEKTRRDLEASNDVRVQDEADEIAAQRTDELTRQLDDANDTIRDLRDELEERQSHVEELCEQIAKLEARA